MECDQGFSILSEKIHVPHCSHAKIFAGLTLPQGQPLDLVLNNR